VKTRRNSFQNPLKYSNFYKDDAFDEMEEKYDYHEDNKK
jgi:hypothetical protein